jgi:hypothetical protein
MKEQEMMPARLLNFTRNRSRITTPHHLLSSPASKLRNYFQPEREEVRKASSKI